MSDVAHAAGAIRIFVDADACPVRSETERVAERHGLRVFMVSDGGIRPSPHPLVETVVVAAGADAADDWIAARIGPGDICVTADIPLAARVIEAGGRTVKPTGEVLDARNIGPALAARDLMADLRAADPAGIARPERGGRPFTKADRGRFADALDRIARRR
jgi:hypothetical protein